jgi:hypothetical protein
MTCSRALFCRGRSRPLAVRYRQPKFNPNRAILSSERNLPPIAVRFKFPGLRIVAQLPQSGRIMFRLFCSNSFQKRQA